MGISHVCFHAQVLEMGSRWVLSMIVFLVVDPHLHPLALQQEPASESIPTGEAPTPDSPKVARSRFRPRVVNDGTCWLCEAQPGVCLDDCSSCVLKRQWKNGGVFLENSTFHCTPSQTGNGTSGRCVTSCSRGCAEQPYACNDVCVDTCFGTCQMTSAFENIAENISWTCKPTGSCVGDCEVDCLEAPRPPLSQAHEYADEMVDSGSTRESIKYSPYMFGVIPVEEVVEQEVESGSSRSVSAHWKNAFRIPNNLPQFELSRITGLDGTCMNSMAYAKAKTTRCRLSSSYVQQMLLQIQGFMMLIHLLGMFYFTKVHQTKRRSFEYLVKAKIEQSAVMVTALMGGVVMVSRTSFMFMDRTLCLTQAGRGIATTFGSISWEVLTIPGFAFAHIILFSYIIATMYMNLKKQPKTSTKLNSDVRTQLKQSVYENDGWDVVCQSTPENIAAKNKCLAEPDGWKWDNLLFRLRKNGLMTPSMANGAVHSYLGFFETFWASAFMFLYVLCVIMFPWVIAFAFANTVLWYPTSAYNKGFFDGLLPGNIFNMGMSEMQLIAIRMGMLCIFFVYLLYDAVSNIMTPENWFHKICSEECVESRRDSKGSQWYMPSWLTRNKKKSDDRCGTKANPKIDNAMYPRCKQWQACMSCDGLQGEQKKACNPHDLHKFEGKSSGTSDSILTAKWGAQERGWMDKMAVCWSLAMHDKDVPEAIPFF